MAKWLKVVGGLVVLLACVAPIGLRQPSRQVVAGKHRPSYPPTTSYRPSSIQGQNPSTVCGSCSSAKGSVGAALAKAHGELRNCLLDGETWVITTLGNGVMTGVIATDHCVNAACLNGQNLHPLKDWVITRPPYKGPVTFLGMKNTKGEIIVDNAGHELTFNVITRRFIH